MGTNKVHRRRFNFGRDLKYLIAIVRMEKYTYKKVLTQKEKGVNIIEDQARKRSIKQK